jgi:hypothetical protein
MPIRFRCAYCNQLMGIARRKAGTVVRCPTCAGQVVVPNPEAAGTEEPQAPDQPEPPEPPSPPPQEAAGKEPPKPDLFERSSFGEEFLSEDEPSKGSTVGRHAGLKPLSPPAGPLPAPPKATVEPRSPKTEASFNGVAPSAPPGIVLSPTKVTILAVLVVLLIGVAFFAGMLVGKS